MIISRIIRRILCCSVSWTFPFILKGRKSIYLTFDDGPHPEYTNKVLEVLDKYNVKATFFLIGKNMESHPEVVKQIIQNGHILGNHTYSHKLFLTMTKNDRIDDFEKCERLISKYQNTKLKLFRPPQGLMNVLDMPYLLFTKHVPFYWSIDSYDFNLSKDTINKSLFNLSNGNNIVLFHDDNSLAIELLHDLIPIWLAKGYQFKTPSI